MQNFLKHIWVCVVKLWFFFLCFCVKFFLFLLLLLFNKMHLTYSVCVSVREPFENESPVYYSFHFPSSYAKLVISHIQLHLSDFIRRAWNQNIITLHPSISRMTSRFLRLWPPASCLNSTALFLPLTLSDCWHSLYISTASMFFFVLCSIKKQKSWRHKHSISTMDASCDSVRSVFQNMTPLVL